MADSQINYDDIEDIRYNALTKTYDPEEYTGVNAEIRTVPASAPYVIKLFESPLQELSGITVTKVSGGLPLQELDIDTVSVVGAGQYAVQYAELANGHVYFNAAEASVQMKIEYKGLGSQFQKISLDSRVPSSGNTTIDGTKTFPERIIGTTGISGIYDEDAGERLLVKRVPLGTWNMDSTGNIRVTLFSGEDKVLDCTGAIVFIINDNQDVMHNLSRANSFPNGNTIAGSIAGIDYDNAGSGDTEMLVQRYENGFFDNTAFDSAINRGYVLLFYIE